MAAPFPIRIRGDAYRNQNSQRSPGLSRDHLLRSQHPAVYLLTVGPRGGSGRLFFAPSAAGNRGSRLGLHPGRRALRGLRILLLPQYDRRAVVLGVVQIRAPEPQAAGLSLQQLLLRCNPGRDAYEETKTEEAQP